MRYQGYRTVPTRYRCFDRGIWSCSLHKGHFGDHVAHQSHDLRAPVLMLWESKEEVDKVKDDRRLLRTA